MAFRETASVRPHDERHVAVGGRTATQLAGKENLRWRGGEEVIAPDDLRHAHQKVVHRGGERVARAVWIAREREVAERPRDILFARADEDVVESHDRPLRHAEAPARRARRAGRRRGVPRGEAPAAGAGVEQLFAGMRRGLRTGHVLAAADARIGVEAGERGAVDGTAFGLDVFLVPVEPEPAQVLDGGRSRTRLVPGMVEILHAEDDLPAAGARAQPGNHERARVAEMQSPGRARREASDIPAHWRFQKSSQAEMKSSHLSPLSTSAVASCMERVRTRAFK